MDKKQYSTNLTFLNLLQIVFITLKLTNYISWSWLWVLSPIWIPISIFVVFTIIIFIVSIIAAIINK